MPEPDGVMNGPLWPADWQTGWVTWRYADLLGRPIDVQYPGATIDISLTVRRAVSLDTKTSVSGLPIPVPVVEGVPSGDLVVLNGAGVPCIEVPLSNDPDIEPTPLVIRFRESWTNRQRDRLVLPEHTLESPLYITGDLDDVTDDPAVSSKLVYSVPLQASGPPPEAAVGDWVLYEDTALLVEVTGL
ncbi:MAG TPA: hypothetical protein VIL55_16700 [Naasia sp.]|jgi:hypothetical protein